MTLRDIEKHAILNAVLTHVNILKAAECLGVPRSTIYRKLRSYGLCKGKRIMVCHLVAQIRRLEDSR